jgi:nucleoside-diphosphate-sugar epimerase
MRLLVTGGSGFLGGYVLAEAARRGHSCVALARSPAAARTVAACGAAPLTGDLDDAALTDVFARARCDALVNLASLGFGHAPAVVGAAASSGLDRAVFVSTTAVTTTVPSRTKPVRLAAEETIRSSGLKWTILRPTMIYGTADDRNLSRLLALLARLGRLPRLGRIPAAGTGRVLGAGLPLVLPVPGGGGGLQQPVHVADAAAAALAAVERPEAACRRYDVAGPSPLTFAELLRLSAAAVNCRVHLVPIPLAPVIAATRGYERVSDRPRIRAEQWQRLAEDKAFPIHAAVRDLGYAPRSFAAGIRAEAAALGLAPAPSAPMPATPLPGSRRRRDRHRRPSSEIPCSALRRARLPRSWASGCRCAARPGCCSTPTPRRATSREAPWRG